MLTAIGWGTVIACMVIGAICWLGIIYYMLRAALQRLPGVPFFSHLTDSPFNVLLRPNQLSEEGAKSLKGFCICVVGFIVSWAVGLTVGITTGVLH